jgi:hypothetical protein
MTYKILDAAASPEGATKIDYTVKEIALAPMTGIAKKKLNEVNSEGTIGFCGITNWEKPIDDKPQFKVITGLTNCKFDTDLDPVDMLAADSVIEDIFAVDGNSLQLGIDYDEDTQQLKTERPTKFNEYKYTKD